MGEISEKISEIKNKIDLKREALKLEIDNKALEIIKELDDYEQECRDNMQKMVKSKMLKSKAVLESMQTEVAKWNEELISFEMNQKKWEIIKSQSKVKCDELVDSMKKLKESLLLEHKLYEFEHRQLMFTDDIKSCTW